MVEDSSARQSRRTSLCCGVCGARDAINLLFSPPCAGYPWLIRIATRANRTASKASARRSKVGPLPRRAAATVVPLSLPRSVLPYLGSRHHGSATLPGSGLIAFLVFDD
jgi:hypothetical protein